MVYFGGDENVSELDRMMIAQLYKCTKNGWNAHFKGWILWYVNFISIFKST